MEGSFDLFVNHVMTVKRSGVAMRASAMGGMQQCEFKTENRLQYTLFRRDNDVYFLAYPENDMIAKTSVSRIDNLIPTLRGLGLIS